ncbi:MAG: hypothetical protein AB1796_11590 [Bacillota bacterium]
MSDKTHSFECDNKCPNCQNNAIQEEGYDLEYQTLKLSDYPGAPLNIVYVICKKCGYIRLFREQS